MVGSILVILGLIAIGMILGGYLVWRQYRHLPTNDALRFANQIYQKKSDDYKALCRDSLNYAEMMAQTAQLIHSRDPTESSQKILDQLDRFIVVLNERAGVKHLTPANGV